MRHITQEERIKIDMINLCKDHKENCEDPACNISLRSAYDLLIMAGIHVTNEEKAVYFS